MRKGPPVDIVGSMEILTGVVRSEFRPGERPRIGCMLAGRAAQDCATLAAPLYGQSALSRSHAAQGEGILPAGGLGTALEACSPRMRSSLKIVIVDENPIRAA